MTTIRREALEKHLEQLNEKRALGEDVRLVEFDAPRFVLSYPDRKMPEGQCIDQDFSDIQFVLHEQEKLDAGIQGARFDEEARRFFVHYEVIDWDA